MPKLYEYFGLVILFYSNDHEPVHVHGKYQEMETKAEFMIDEGQIIEIRYVNVKGKAPARSKTVKRFSKGG